MVTERDGHDGDLFCGHACSVHPPAPHPPVAYAGRRVRGHKRYPETRPYVAGQPSKDTTGMIICQCGEYSTSLPDATARERWYRAHLAEVVAR